MRIFPFKSLDGVDVDAAAFTRAGGLRRDREFALFDAGGAVNGKRVSEVHTLRVSFDRDLTLARFTSGPRGESFAFAFDADPAGLAWWLTRHFGRSIEVRRDPDGGFPDDTAAPGPTVVSTATLEAVAGWFPGLTAGSVRDRLRTNIEIGGVPAFWEDRLYGAAGTLVPFRIGDVTLAGTNPCQRCVVPSRDPHTGAAIAGFAKRVAVERAATLPAWADTSRFDHYYRLAVNTRPAAVPAGAAIRVGDTLTPAVLR